MTLQSIKRFIVENGLQTTILQSDNQQGDEADATSRMSTSSTPFTSGTGYSGEIPYHQTIFTQLGGYKVQFCRDCTVDNKSIGSHSSPLNHIIPLATSQGLATKEDTTTCRWKKSKDFIR
eukprot:2657636-Amphidinium_carterae.2